MTSIIGNHLIFLVSGTTLTGSFLMELLTTPYEGIKDVEIRCLLLPFIMFGSCSEIVWKCFICGATKLKESKEGLAFFSLQKRLLPLMPLDARSRGAAFLIVESKLDPKGHFILISTAEQ